MTGYEIAGSVFLILALIFVNIFSLTIKVAPSYKVAFVIRLVSSTPFNCREVISILDDFCIIISVTGFNTFFPLFPSP